MPFLRKVEPWLKPYRFTHDSYSGEEGVRHGQGLLQSVNTTQAKVPKRMFSVGLAAWQKSMARLGLFVKKSHAAAVCVR